MKWIWLLALAGCSISERESPLLLNPPFLITGMKQGEIAEILGPPDNRNKSEFGRETWAYPALEQEFTYCNTSESPGLYFFPSSHPSELYLLFGEEGTLEDFSYRVVSK